jgi:hypothetical protein
MGRIEEMARDEYFMLLACRRRYGDMSREIDFKRRCMGSVFDFSSTGPRCTADATVVCESAEGDEWFACDTPEHRTGAAKTTEISVWFLRIRGEL